VWGKPQGKIPLGSPRRRWEESSEFNVKEMSSEDVDRTDFYNNGIRKNINYRPT
jgi:hypothetical protein